MNFFHILTLIFIALKLTDQVAWAWIWVLSPSIIHALRLVILLATFIAMNRR